MERMGIIKIMGENLTTGATKVIKKFSSSKDAATYGRSLKKHLMETNEGYEETFGFASICCAIGPNGDKYQYYYSL